MIITKLNREMNVPEERLKEFLAEGWKQVEEPKKKAEPKKQAKPAAKKAK